jgi:hypothetical protein
MGYQWLYRGFLTPSFERYKIIAYLADVVGRYDCIDAEN